MKEGDKKMTVYLRKDQWLSMRAIALENAMEFGGTPDVSALLRTLIDVYLEGRGKAVTKAKRPNPTRPRKRPAR